MAQNYNRKNRSTANRKSAEPRVPAWVWLFTGCVLGAFIMFLMRLSELDPVRRVNDPKSPPSSTQTKAKETTKPAEPRFDFYDLLKETQVSVPKFSQTKEQQQQAIEAQAQEYILQVASFKHRADAEQLKVELILLNLDAEIEQAKIRNGETWNRVLVGPFSSRSQLAKARSTLVSNHHEALVLKRAPATNGH